MNTSTRRHFLKCAAAILAGSLAPAITGCSTFEPQPFIAGEIAGVPLGCAELRSRDIKGDC